MRKWYKVIVIVDFIIIFIFLFILYDSMFHAGNIFYKYYTKTSGKTWQEKESVQKKVDKLSIVTFNIWSGLNYQGNVKMGWYEEKAIREKRYQYFIEEILKIEPDIIALNEVNYLPWFVREIVFKLNQAIKSKLNFS